MAETDIKGSWDLPEGFTAIADILAEGKVKMHSFIDVIGVVTDYRPPTPTRKGWLSIPAGQILLSNSVQTSSARSDWLIYQAKKNLTGYWTSTSSAPIRSICLSAALEIFWSSTRLRCKIYYECTTAGSFLTNLQYRYNNAQMSASCPIGIRQFMSTLLRKFPALPN